MAVIKSATDIACALGAALAITGASIAGGMSPIITATTAIRIARHVCVLKEQPLPGRWQAVLVKDLWHVWFGTNSVEPKCGFDGAYVEADGSFTGCVISTCKDVPPKSN